MLRALGFPQRSVSVRAIPSPHPDHHRSVVPAQITGIGCGHAAPRGTARSAYVGSIATMQNKATVALWPAVGTANLAAARSEHLWQVRR